MTSLLMTEEVNLAPFSEYESPRSDRGGLTSAAGGPSGLSPCRRSTMSILRTKFCSLRQTTVHSTRDQLEEETFRSKMRVLTKNPAIFHEFKDRLAQAQEQSHSNEGVTILLYDFLDNYLRMPELRDEINHGGENPMRRGLRQGRAGRRPLGLLASYLGGESSPTVRGAQLEKKSSPRIYDPVKSTLLFDKLEEERDESDTTTSSETSCSENSGDCCLHVDDDDDDSSFTSAASF